MEPPGPGRREMLTVKEERERSCRVSERLQEQEGENLTVKKETEEARRRLMEEEEARQRLREQEIGMHTVEEILTSTISSPETRVEGMREGERAEGERTAEVVYLHSRARGKVGHVTLSTKSVIV